MNRTFTYLVTEADANLTIEWFLRKRGYSRHILTELKRTKNGICKNGIWSYTNQPVQTKDRITVTLAETEHSERIVPRPVPFSVVYEDDDILVVNKPANTPIHPSIGNYENTLANGIAWYYSQKGESFVYRCINRLDRDTTGLILLARHALSGAVLSASMRKREIHRTYAAFASGCLPDSGTIDAPIARMPGSVIMRCVDFENGDRSVTHYRTLLRKNSFSYLSIRLETGRTHQIRVHMSHIGHPLLGDSMYGPDVISTMKRQALHSAALSFPHPITGKQMDFEAPLPDDMRSLLS